MSGGGSGKFSAGLRLVDLNDFIAPSQNCIVSLRADGDRTGTPSSSSSSVKRQPAAVLKLKDLKDEGAVEGAAEKKEEAVKISLKDCLACSGCITSAETVMLERQGLGEFISHLNSSKAVVISVSQQSRASLAALYHISPRQVFGKLTNLFKSMGARAVYDTSCSRDISLIESCNEFISRYRQNQEVRGEGSSASCLPMLSSSCPGWICYAEKTLGSYILPYISSVKSPQQAIGSAIKHHVVGKLGLKPDDVYHVTVMPCYDKKLEAVRDDFVFTVDNKEIVEVDLVLTSGEVLDFIKAKSVDFTALDESPLDKMLTNVREEGHLYGVSGGSGGYAETIFRHAAHTLFGVDIEGPVEFKILRNSDFREAILEVDGKQVLKFALCYGFRNLQNIVRKIKIGKCDYDYIEVMACPSGCLNGGGQLPPEKGQSAKELIQILESIYMQDVLPAEPFDNPIVRKLYDEWLGQPGSENARKYLHTAYHPVLKSITTQMHDW